MAYNKIVDSAQLDAALTATANAIREKTGGTESLEWVANKGFADIISAIESGGGNIGGRDFIYTTYTPSEDVTTAIAIPIDKHFGEQQCHNRVVYWTTPLNRESSSTPSKINFGITGVSYYGNPNRAEAIHCVANKYGSIGYDLSHSLSINVNGNHIDFRLDSSLIIKAGTTVHFLVIDTTNDFI